MFVRIIPLRVIEIAKWHFRQSVSTFLALVVAFTASPECAPSLSVMPEKLFCRVEAETGQEMHKVSRGYDSHFHFHKINFHCQCFTGFKETYLVRTHVQKCGNR